MRTVTWTGTLTATSSIAHAGQTRGTITLLRRELMVTADGALLHVPIISGNTLRGRLRRIGEELLRDAVGYEGLLPAAAAHALRGGGSLAKTGREPLSGARLQQLRQLVPQIAVFGAAAGGTIIGGALDVGKAVPLLAETAHITGVPTTRSAFTATQLESYTRQDDTGHHDFTAVPAPDRPTGRHPDAVDLEADTSPSGLRFDDAGRPEPTSRGTNQMLFHLETFPVGTTFHTWLRLRRPAGVELSFFTDVLAAFVADGRLGGRIGIGHGQVRADLTHDHDLTGGEDHDQPDGGSWRDFVDDHRADIATVLGELT